MNPLPNLPGVVHVARDKDQLLDDLASAVSGAATRAIDERGVFHLALSGGGTPEPFYMRLVIDPSLRSFPWEKTHVWIVDERRVPEDDERNNHRMIREAMLNHVPIKPAHDHPMPVLSDDPAGEYEAALREAFAMQPADTAPPRLDFVLLGMGGDAHTASLFPNSPALDEDKRWIAVNEGPTVTPPDRVTMTYPLLNAARELGVMLVGAGKHDTLTKINEQMANGPDIASMPITGIDPSDGSLTWYLDPAAATGDAG